MTEMLEAFCSVREARIGPETMMTGRKKIRRKKDLPRIFSLSMRAIIMAKTTMTGTEMTVESR